MPITITDSGHITNDVGPADNPREEEYFEHAVQIDDTSCSGPLSWSIAGDIPLDVTIDGNGVIKGTVKGMWIQPSTQDNKPLEYMEVDCRKYPEKNGRFKHLSYDFVFDVTVTWNDLDGGGGCSIPGSATSTVFITLVKDHDADHMLMATQILDGALGREPYHCAYSGPQNQNQCELIGGTWDEEHQRCSIGVPQTQAVCESLGGTWEEKSPGGPMVCNLTIIQTRAEAELIGGVWKKNTLWQNGVEYDNATDYLNSAVPAFKLTRLADVLN